MVNIALALFAAFIPQQANLDFVQLSEDETGGPLFRVEDVQLSDRIWILDAGNSRVVGALPGEAPVILGRSGKGPGEFQRPVAMFAGNEGNIAVWENSPPRLTWFRRAAKGNWSVESSLFRLAVPGLAPYVGYPIRDGAAVLLNTSYRPFDEQPEKADAVVVLADSEAAEADTLGRFPLSGAVTYRAPSSAIPNGFRFVVTTPYADSPPLVARGGACGGLLAVSGLRDSLEVAFFDHRARLVGRATFGLRGPSTSEADWQEYLSGREDDLRRFLSERPRPARYPPISAMRLTRSGHVLVQHSVRRSESPQMRRWSVWPLHRSGQGVQVGEGISFALPAAFEAMDLADGRVWGVFRGHLGTEMVRGYVAPRRLPVGCATAEPGKP